MKVVVSVFYSEEDDQQNNQLTIAQVRPCVCNTVVVQLLAPTRIIVYVQYL
jgi:hypothetical protein